MSARFRSDYHGIGEMLTAPFMVRAMRARATKVKARAIQLAPVYEKGPHPGRYKAAFEVSSGVRHGEGARAYGKVTNTAPEAVYVEFGNKNVDAHHTLVKALEAVSYLSGRTTVAQRRARE